MSNPLDSSTPVLLKPIERRQMFGLGVLFGTAYFIQGIAEPNEGLISQPVRSLLLDWGHSATDVSWFWFVVGMPWSIKPLFGLLTDFVPIFGSRRRSYLIVMTAATVLGFLYLFRLPPQPDGLMLFMGVLLVPTVGVAFTDVVIDALMVERGQPLAMTGRLQSVQWAAIYAATIATGFVGGWLSQHDAQTLGFAICAATTGVMLVIAILLVREPERAAIERPKQAAGELWQAFRSPPVLLAAAFLFLWNFNPFSSTIQQIYMTKELGFSEQFYGNLTSVFAMAAMAGSAAFGLYCRRVSFHVLLHVAIVAGVLATLAYWGIQGTASAVAVMVVVGITYMTGNLIQLDLAARACPPHVAGTVFALLMSLSNFAMTLSTLAGGPIYDYLKQHWGAAAAFNLLVAVGAGFTAFCWILVPWLLRHGKELSEPHEST